MEKKIQTGKSLGNKISNKIALYGFMLVLLAGAFDMVMIDSVALDLGLVYSIIFVVMASSMVLSYVDSRFEKLERMRGLLAEK